jgi:hypothetical protein
MPSGPPWQNHGRLLTEQELDEIRRAVSGIHFNKELAGLDENGVKLLACAEALLRDVDRIHPEGFGLPYREGAAVEGPAPVAYRPGSRVVKGRLLEP